MEKKNRVLPWTLRLLKPWIPALILLVLCNVASAVFSVWFALGSKAVIDAAQKRESQEFISACIRQGALIMGILLDNVLIYNLRERLNARIDRDMKKRFHQHLVHFALGGIYDHQVGFCDVRFNCYGAKADLCGYHRRNCGGDCYRNCSQRFERTE